MRQSLNGGWQKKAGKREREADVTARNGGSREQQVVDAKERSTDVKSWGNKKVALILAGRPNKGPWQQATRGLARNSGGKNGRKQNERLKIPSSRHNGILSRHLRPFFSLSLSLFLFLSLSLLFLSFHSNSAYRTRKQIKLRVKRKIEILRGFFAELLVETIMGKFCARVSSHARLLILQKHDQYNLLLITI